MSLSRLTAKRMDALPVWLALPLGLCAGAGLGYWLAMAPLAPSLGIIAGLALVAAWQLGHSCNQTAQPTRPQAAGANGAGDMDGDDLLL